MSYHPPGLIAVLAQESARFSTFAESLSKLQMPEGSRVAWRIGWGLAQAHNALIEELLADPDLGWIWFMGDDHVFSPDLLTKLLDRELDVVVPLCLMRAAPFRPVNWVADGDGETRRIKLADYPDGGLAWIDAAGAAGLLVRRHVFDAIEPPWFESGTGLTSLVGEDINFCRKVRATGREIACDLDAMLGHSLTACVWPVREPDGWTFGFSMAGGFEITMPPHMQAHADRVGG